MYQQTHKNTYHQIPGQPEFPVGPPQQGGPTPQRARGWGSQNYGPIRGARAPVARLTSPTICRQRPRGRKDELLSLPSCTQLPELCPGYVCGGESWSVWRGAGALALWQVTGPQGRAIGARAPITSEWLCFCPRNGAYLNGFKCRSCQNQSREGTMFTGKCSGCCPSLVLHTLERAVTELGVLP